VAPFLSLVLCVPGAVLAPSALAQDATEPAPTELGVDLAPVGEPSALCGVLTDDEVSAALGASLTVSDGTDYDCSWGSSTSDAYLIVTRDAGDLDLDAREAFPDGVAVDFDGKPGWYSPESLVVFVDVGDGLLFTAEYFGTPPDDLDLQAALTGLAATAVPRLATIPVPTEEPEPTLETDPVLEALIPTQVGEAETSIDFYTADDLVAYTDPEDPAMQGYLNVLATIVGAHGKTLADVSFADADFSTDSAYGILTAVRVAGADVAAFADALADNELQLEDPRRSPAVIGGHQVTVVTDGPPASESPEPSAADGDEPLPPSYLYPSGEVLFIVSADEPQLTQLFELLP
jgi:hypothetical protein